MTDKLSASREIISRHKGKVVSATGIAALITVLASLGISPLDIIFTYSNEYQSDMQNLEIKIDSLEASNRDLLSRVEHNAHIMKTQNLMLRKMRNTNMISNEEYDSAMHSTDH